MASFNDIKTGNIVFNKVTEDLLKTMQIEPNQFYITPDDESDTEVTPVTVSNGKPWVMSIEEDGVNSLVAWVNSELDTDLFEAQVINAPSQFDDMPPEMLPIYYLWLYSMHVEMDPTSNILDLIEIIVELISHWSYTNLNNWLSLDTFEPETLLPDADTIILNHIENWCYFKMNNATIKWRKFSDDADGANICAFKFDFNGAVLTLVMAYNTDGILGQFTLFNTTLANAFKISTGLNGSTGDFVTDSELNNAINNFNNSINNITYNTTKITNNYGGFAAGRSAESTGSGIQLGAGTNATDKTLQVFDYKLLDENGIIPNERLNIDLTSNDEILAMIDEATPKVVDIASESLV